MSHLGSAVRNAAAAGWTWFVLVVTMVLFFPFILLWSVVGWPFDRVNYLGGRLFRLAGVITVRLTPRWQFSVRGVIPENPRAPYVVVANHESFADMLLLCLLPWEMKWVAKVEFMRIPVLGWSMWAAHDIPLNRGRAASARAAMAACQRRLAARVSVMMFPEGTRSPHRDLLPFKDGAFRLAIEAGVPVLPLVIYGTRDAIARHDWHINSARAVVEVLTPELSAGLSPADLKQRVRERIQAARDRLRDELEGADKMPHT